MGIKICPECGGKVSDTRTTCMHCGYDFAAAPQKILCPDCDEWVVKNADGTCPVCGHVFDTAKIDTALRKEKAAAETMAQTATAKQTEREKIIDECRKYMTIEKGDLIEYTGKLAHVIIPPEVTTIFLGACDGHEEMKILDIPDTVTELCACCFSRCGITSLVIPDSITDISGFDRCISLIKVTLPSTATIINGTAFEGCSSLPYISIPDKVESIWLRAFKDCTALARVELPTSLKIIKEGAFENCAALTTIVYKGTKAQWKAVTKEKGWDKKVGKYTVHCTDGDIKERG